MKKSFFVALLFIAGSCIKPETPPVGTIPPDSMVPILVDIHIAEAKVSYKALSPDSSRLYYQAYKNNIFNKYHISENRFDKSMEFYSRNTQYLDKIYEKVVDSLGLREARGKLD